MTRSKALLANLLSLGSPILFNLLERCQSNNDDDDDVSNDDDSNGDDDANDDNDDSFVAVIMVLPASLLSLGTLIWFNLLERCPSNDDDDDGGDDDGDDDGPDPHFD